MPRKMLFAALGLLAVGGSAAGALSYLNLARLRKLPVTEQLPTPLADGCYRGRADCGFVYEVEVAVEANAFHDIAVVNNRDAHYALIAEAVLPRIIERQSPAVDVITGASTTSKCLMRATADAVSSPDHRGNCAHTADSSDESR